MNNDYSKNELPGTAPNAVVAGIDIISKAGCYMNVTCNYTGKSALNDANAAYASSYHLLGAKLGSKKDFAKKFSADICRR